jgi:hypothetical protein
VAYNSAERTGPHKSSSLRCAALALGIVLPGAFLSGCIGMGEWKNLTCYFITVFNSIILCQYVGCCGAHGTVSYFLNTSLAFTIGSVLSVLVANLIFPW